MTKAQNLTKARKNTLQTISREYVENIHITQK